MSKECCPNDDDCLNLLDGSCCRHRRHATRKKKRDLENVKQREWHELKHSKRVDDCWLQNRSLVGAELGGENLAEVDQLQRQ
jgi:hypothetical protein